MNHNRRIGQSMFERLENIFTLTGPVTHIHAHSSNQLWWTELQCVKHSRLNAILTCIHLEDYRLLLWIHTCTVMTVCEKLLKAPNLSAIYPVINAPMKKPAARNTWLRSANQDLSHTRENCEEKVNDTKMTKVDISILTKLDCKLCSWSAYQHMKVLWGKKKNEVHWGQTQIILYIIHLTIPRSQRLCDLSRTPIRGRRIHAQVWLQRDWRVDWCCCCCS